MGQSNYVTLGLPSKLIKHTSNFSRINEYFIDLPSHYIFFALFYANRRVESSTEAKLRAVVGSPYWMAPEVVGSERHSDSSPTYDSRADVWSLGITAIELGDCEPPNVDVYAPRILFQILQNPPPTLLRTADWTQLYNDFIAE